MTPFATKDLIPPHPTPLVSILIPAYRAERWIGETLKSALSQTWPRKEIILVDDGSPDGTLNAARGFQGPHVQVVTQENQGASAARNHAYSLAQGEFIQWLDADDILATDKIERQMRVALADGDPRILYSGAWGWFLENIEKADFDRTALWVDLSPAEFLRRKMGQNLHMQPDCWLVSRELTEAAGPWDETLWRDNDGEYFCRVLLAARQVKFVEEARSFYRKSGTGSVSFVGSSQKKVESLHRSVKLHIQYLRSLDDGPDSHAACLFWMRTWLPYFFPERMDLVDELRALAAELGGDLPDPVVRPKYRLIQQIFGYRAAKTVQRTLPIWKTNAARLLDRLGSQNGK